MTCLCLSCHFRTLLPFTCVDDTCSVFLRVRLALSAFTPAAASSLFFDLTLCLVVSGHAGSTGLHVWWSLLALFLTRAFCTSGTVSSAAVHGLFIVSLFVCTLFSRGALHLALHLWTDVWSFLHFSFVRPAFELRTKCSAHSLHSEPRSTYILKLICASSGF